MSYLWLLQAPTSFPSLTWQIVLWLIALLGLGSSLLVAVLVLLYKRDWQIIESRFALAEERRAAIMERVAALERRVGDLEP